MKQLIAVIAIFIAGYSTGYAQNVATADTSLKVHYNIYTNLAEQGANGATVKLDQPAFVKQAVMQLAAKNERTFTQNGYRIRIFSDNKQNSRQESEALVVQLEAKYPNVKAYRSYSSPYFRVSIGDFRTLNEAKAFLEIIKIEYPKAYPVKEKINFPPL
jgi:Sporulation related domain.